MTPLLLTAIELAFKLIESAVAAGELTPEQVQQRLASANASADAAEARVDDRLKQE